MKCLNCQCETKNKKFCSLSCSATYTNKLKPIRAKRVFCKNCGKTVENKDKLYCSDSCKKENRVKNLKWKLFPIGNIPKNKLTDEQIFCENSTVARHVVKREFLKTVPHQCIICGQPDEWNNIKLVLVLDHINGINNDNRRENLRLLCPNCNSQQDTFAGRNVGKKK